MNRPASQENLMQSKYSPISFYRKLTDKTSKPVSMEQLFEGIRTGKGFSQVIEQLRAEPAKAKQDTIKKNLPAVTVSGLFGAARKLEYLQAHSGFTQIDFDNVPDLRQATSILQKDKYSFAVFLSPSGKGIKVIVKIPANAQMHVGIFRQLSAYYQKEYSLKVDEQCKDVTRLMFLSYDPNLFVNEGSATWTEVNKEAAFEDVLDKISQKEKFEPGKRNPFVFKLACECYKAGIVIEKTISDITLRFASADFTATEIETTVKSAYNHKQNTNKPIAENNIGSGSSVLRRAEIYLENKYEIRLNEVSGRVESRLKDSSESFTELNEANIFRELQHNNIPLSIPKISTLLQSDFVPKYNPFQSYFEGLGAWDKETETDFIEKLCSYLPVVAKERFQIQFKKWVVRCIACALKINDLNKQVLVFVGEGQNTGKSTFCRWLCPPNLFEYFTEYVAQDKDGLIALSSNFIINLDELATLSKADINSLKSFISKDKINVRLPYARRSSMQPRRTNFIGSTNNDEFLIDETGNVRWLCFELLGVINFAYKQDININDIWRQAYSLYQNGFQYHMTADEIRENEKVNSRHLISSPELEMIDKYFEPASSDEGEFKTATDVLAFISIQHSTIKLNDRRIGKAMKVLGFEKGSKYTSEKGQSIKGYYVKQKNL